jgi:hypothetical protein
MRNAAIGLLGIAVLVIGFSGILRRDDVNAQTPRPVPNSVPSATTPGHAMASAGKLMAFSSNASEAINQVTVIDAEQRVMSVYHIDKATGRIELKGVRNIRFDLMMEEYNGVTPLPREIRDLLNQ